MLNNMTIKMKLILSFSIILILVAALSIYSIYGLNKSSSGFTSYQATAKDTILASTVQSNMLMMRINVINYLKDGSQKNIDNFNQFFNKTDSFLNTAIKEIKNPKRVSSIKKINSELSDYKLGFNEVVSFMNERDKIVNSNLNINGKRIEKLLTSVMLSSEKDEKLKVSLEVSHAIRVLLLGRLYVMKFLEVNSKEYLDRAQKEFVTLNNEFETILSLVEDNKRKKSLNEAKNSLINYNSGLNNLIAIISKRNEIIEKKLEVIGPNIASLIEEVNSSIKDEQNSIGSMVLKLNNSITNTSLIVSLIIIVAIIFFAITIPLNIIAAIKRLNEGILKLLNSKDVSSRVEVKSKDEIAEVSNNFNKYLETIENGLIEDLKVIDDVKRVVNEAKDGILYKKVELDTQNESLHELRGIFNQMLDIMAERVCGDMNKVQFGLEKFQELDFTHRIPNPTGNTSQGLNALAEIINEMLTENKANGLTLQKSANILLENVEILSNSTNEAASSLEETAAALEQITSNITQNTENVVKMAGYAKELTNSANGGQKLATQTTSAMDEINQQVNAINEAITVIDQIAFQTNILSLNAAVEAATAGEAGKGFAVVAQEVRNLAGRSAEAADEIKQIVENATLKANDGKNIADKMIHGYHDLNENISKTIEIINDIEMSSKEQQSGIEQINDAVTELDQQTQENASVATHTREVAIQTQHIAKTVVKNADEKKFIGKESVKEKDLHALAQMDIENFEIKNKGLEKKDKEISSIKNTKDEWESF